MSFIISCLLFLLDVLLSLFFLPLVFILFGPVLLYRQWVLFFAKLVYPSYIAATVLDQLSGRDIFEAQRNGAPIFLSEGTIFTILGRIDVERVRHEWKSLLIEARAPDGSLLYPKLSSSVTQILGYLFFKPIQNLDLRRAIHEVKLGEDETLEEFKSKFLRAVYPKGAPLWEVAVLFLQDESVILTRIHHSIADGYTVMYLNSIFLGENPQFQNLLSQSGHHFFHKVLALLEAPRRLIELGVDTQATKGSIQIVSDPNLQPRIGFMALNFSLYAGVLRRILEDAQLKIGNRVAIGTTIPKPNHPIQMGKMANHFSTSLFCIPLKETDVLKRLNESDQAIKLYNERKIDSFQRYIAALVGALPLSVIKGFVETSEKVGGVKAMCSTFLTFKESGHQIQGKPVVGIAPLISTCAKNVVFGESAIVEDGRCAITFLAPSEAVPSQQRLEEILQYFKDELESLLSAIERKENYGLDNC